MNGEDYNSEIKLSNSCLDIVLNYMSPVTSEEVDCSLDFFQYRLSEKADKEVPREEIKINLKEGDLIDRRTVFRVTLEKDLYVGLEAVNRKAPYALPNLIDDLRKYGVEHDLQDNETKLINKTVDGLRRIINS